MQASQSLRTPRGTIRSQLLRPLLLTFVFGVLATAGISAWINSQRQVQALRERQSEVARVLRVAQFPLTSSVLSQIALLSGEAIIVRNPQERTIEASGLAADVPLPAWNDPIWDGLPDFDADPRYMVIAGQSFWGKRTNLVAQPEVEAIVLATDRSLTAARWDGAWPPLAVGSGILALLLPWLWRLTGRWTQRIEAVESKVSAIAGQLAATSESLLPGDELGRLLQNVSSLGERLSELQAVQMQSERQRLLTLWIAGFSHQFRNGIAGAKLAVQLHRQRCQSAAEPSLDVADRQLSLLETELRGILTLTRREEAPARPVELAEVLKEAVGLTEPTCQHRGVELVRPVECPNVSILGSADGLRAALVNLLLNAVEATGSGGRIRLQCWRSAEAVTIEVSDNGPGPPADLADELLKPFVTSKPEGVGIGLTIAAAIVERHGGRLHWDRTDGWTNFRCQWPKQALLNEKGNGSNPGN